MKKCFTINCMRKKEDFIGYDKIISEGLFQGVELFYPYNVDESQAKLYEEEVRKLLNKHQDIEVVLHLPHGGVNNLVNKDGSKNNDIYERMIGAINFANKFNVHKLTLHLGSSFKDDGVSRAMLVDGVILVLKELCDYAKRYKMNVMIENMPRDSELGYSPDEILYIINNVGKDNLKFIMDTGHAHVSSYELSLYVEKLKDYLYHMHFSDNHGISDEHKPIGEGNIDFKSLFIDLKKVKYNELHCLEILFNDYTDLIRYAKKIDEFDYLYK